MMSKKLFGSFMALALAAVATIAPAQSSQTSPEVKKEVLERMNRLIERNAFVPGVDFRQWDTYLDKVRGDVDKAQTEEEFASTINSALRNFGFSHIALQTPREGKIFRTGQTVGIGITSQITDDGVLVVRVVPGAPADKAGLKPGDLIVEVEGEKAKGITKIIGAEGTQVHLKVKSEDGTVKDHTLTRAKFSTVRPEELEWLDDNTAKLSVFTFATGYNPKRIDDLMKQASRAKNLVLDLRDNGGGAVINLQHLLGYFLDGDTAVGTFVDKEMLQSYLDSKKVKEANVTDVAKWSREQQDFWFQQIRPAKLRSPRYQGRIAVLVNPGSGSASEIAAAALREFAGAQIIGQKSAGAVLVSVVVPATHDFMLQYPLSDYVTAKGLRLEGNGVKPDIESKEARVRLPGQPDEAVDVAKAYFTKTKTNGSGIGLN
jgi:carboxyl-terminal processing protease